MSRIGSKLREWIVFCHRWMGLALCLMFVVWFCSGFVMMYWSYPSVSPADRLHRAQALDATKIRVSPQQALASLQLDATPAAVRLNVLDGRPVYRFAFSNGLAIVYADTGQVLDEVDPALALRIASAWTGMAPESAKAEGPVPIPMTQPDQWTVDGTFSTYSPLIKYSWPNGDQVYVSLATADVAQYTTRASRTAAYFGAIPHWIYFTRLRRRAALWSRIVIWMSGAGAVALVLGLVAGWSIYSPSKRYRYLGGPSHIPYAGQKRWHATLGLIFGVVACTWVFSGMLSMEPFAWLSEGSPLDARVATALRGDAIQLAAFAAKPPGQAIEQIAPNLRVKELEMASFAGEPFYLALESPQRSGIVPVQGYPEQELDPTTIVSVVNRASEPFYVAEMRLVTKYEAYYLDRQNALPLPALFVRMNDPAGSMYYIDPRTGNAIEGYSARSRWNRWLYHGLHSINFPWLYRYRPAWDIVVLTLLLGGTALSMTSVVLAWQVVRRKAGAR